MFSVFGYHCVLSVTDHPFTVGRKVQGLIWFLLWNVSSYQVSLPVFTQTKLTQCEGERKNSKREWNIGGKKDHWVPSCRLATTEDCYLTQMNHFHSRKMYSPLCYGLQSPLMILADTIFSSKPRLFIFYCWVTSLASRNTAHSLPCGSRNKHLGIRFFAHELRKLKLRC